MIDPGHPHALRQRRRHLHSAIGMIEQSRPCVALAQQLHAVESAVREAKKALFTIILITVRKPLLVPPVEKRARLLKNSKQ